jgi:hypothetical protein
MLRLNLLSSVLLDSILQFRNAMLARTVSAAVKLAISDLHAVPDDHASTVGAPGRQGMDRAFEAVKHVRLIPHHHFKRLIIFISADFTLSHFFLPFTSIDQHGEGRGLRKWINDRVILLLSRLSFNRFAPII